MELDRIVLDRRNALRLLAGAGFVALAGCASSKVAKSSATTTTSGATASTATTGSTAAAGSLTRIPEETGGPFPADGSNGPDVLTENGVVRKDITKSFGSQSGTADGVPMTIKLTLVDARKGTPLAGAAVYAWHCDREGRYSLYSDGATDQNYLRGVQVADAKGVVEFTSIFPACYPGRWPHVHFEIYDTVDDATSSGQPRATSQLAIPEATCTTVYATSGYADSAQNLDGVTLQSDNVFGDDGGVHELADVTGSVEQGYVVALTVPV